jgi:REP element-mobilizing transposase RayT
MARKVRLECAGAVCHVMARGNQGRRIYGDDSDRKLWLETLAEGCEQTGWRIHASVMMADHYHLPPETPERNWVAGMKWLQSTHTRRHNVRHRVFGHLFHDPGLARMKRKIEQAALNAAGV